MAGSTVVLPVHGAKHIARLKRRAAALAARIKASPQQADFDDERAELKSLLWVINLLEKKNGKNKVGDDVKQR